MSRGNWARLTDRGVVEVRGPDASAFLQNLVTNDIEAVTPGSSGYGALLTPQGKVQFDFIVFARDGAYLFDLPRAATGDFARRLGFYRLRAKVEIADRSGELDVVAAWGGEAPLRFASDPRLPALGFRGIVPADADPAGASEETDTAAYARHRVLLGVPEAGADFAYGDAFPHDADLDQLTGIDFTKGCFVGQEVVSRMQHRGTARRRIVQVRGAGLAPGAELLAGNQAIGTIGSAGGETGLAMVRLDRAAAALAAGEPIVAGGAPAEIVIPVWATFTMPSVPESAA